MISLKLVDTLPVKVKGDLMRMRVLLVILAEFGLKNMGDKGIVLRVSVGSVNS